MIIVILVLLGLCAGSFINALVWRLYMQYKTSKKPASKKKSGADSAKYSITRGRSMCTDCGYTLSAKDLIPLVSWLMLRGKCRYCGKPISAQYPLIEILTAGLFVMSYIFWPIAVSGLQVGVFAVWLAILTGLIALLVYDAKYMILPDKIVFSLYILGVIFAGLQLADEGFSANKLVQVVLAVILGGGLFWLAYQVSRGKWIGGGDVKLGFLLGLLCLTPAKSFLMLFAASLLGMVYIIPGMLLGKIGRKSRVPFGPFLVLSAIIVVLFGAWIVDWYSSVILLNSI